MHEATLARTRGQARRRRGMRVGLAVFVALSAGCASIDTHADWDPAVDFLRLQTWKWAQNAQTMTGNTAADTDGLLARRVTAAIDQTLSSKGYVETGTDQADFEVAWFFTVEDRTQVTTINDYQGYGAGYRGWYGAGYGGYSTSQTMVDNYRQGTLIIDVKDGASGELIWRGSGSARLKEKTDPATAQARANDAVAQILARFPPPSSK